MLDQMTSALDFQGKALVLRAERQRTIASNIANIDTPGYKSRDFNFSQALTQALSGGSGSAAGTTLAQPSASATAGQIPLGTLQSEFSSTLQYAAQTQPAMDSNSVDIDRERASFADNSIRYEAALRFINGDSRTILSAIQGQ
jgi:flagellar basal-body rod protein FlgB